MAETGVAAMAGGVLVPGEEKTAETGQRSRYTHTEAEKQSASLEVEGRKQATV